MFFPSFPLAGEFYAGDCVIRHSPSPSQTYGQGRYTHPASYTSRPRARGHLVARATGCKGLCPDRSCYTLLQRLPRPRDWRAGLPYDLNASFLTVDAGLLRRIDVLHRMILDRLDHHHPARGHRHRLYFLSPSVSPPFVIKTLYASSYLKAPSVIR